MISIRKCILSVILIALIATIPNCGNNKKIIGTVIDQNGNQLSNVNVKIDGSTFETTTDISGQYSLDYVPGEIRVVFSKSNYIGETLDLNISQKTRYPAQTITLYEIPEDAGIVFLSDSGYVELNKWKVNKSDFTTTDNFQRRYHRGYSLTGEPTIIDTTEYTFLDFDPSSKKLYRVKNYQHIGRITTARSGLVLESLFSDEIEEEIKILTNDYKIRTGNLSQGGYVYVNTERGLNNYINRRPEINSAYFFYVFENKLDKEKFKNFLKAKRKEEKIINKIGKNYWDDINDIRGSAQRFYYRAEHLDKNGFKEIDFDKINPRFEIDSMSKNKLTAYTKSAIYEITDIQEDQITILVYKLNNRDPFFKAFIDDDNFEIVLQ